jgi:hypothetical protein
MHFLVNFFLFGHHPINCIWGFGESSIGFGPYWIFVLLFAWLFGLNFDTVHHIRVEPPAILNSFGCLHGLTDKVTFERRIEFIVDFVDFLWFIEFLDMFVKLKELHHVIFFK